MHLKPIDTPRLFTLPSEGSFLPHPGIAIRFEPDGRRVRVLTCRDLSIWNTTTWERLEQVFLPRVESKSPFPTAFGLTNDGSTVMVTPGGTIRLIDSSGGNKREFRFPFHAPEGRVEHAAISADGRWVFAGGRDLAPVKKPRNPGDMRQIQPGIVWDASSGEEVTRFRMSDLIMDAVFDPAGRWLATFTLSKRLDCYAMPTGKKLHKFTPGAYSYHPLAASHDGRLLALSADGSGGLIVFDTQSGETVMRTRGTSHEKHPRAICFSPNDELLATCDYHGRVSITEIATGEERVAYRGDISDHWFGVMAFSPDAKTLLLAGNHALRPLDASTGKVLRPERFHCCRIDTVAFDTSRNRLITGSDDRSILVWNTGDASVTRRLELDAVPGNIKSHPAGVIAFVSGGFAGRNGRVRLHDADSGKLLYSGDPSLQQSILDFTPDGRWLLLYNVFKAPDGPGGSSCERPELAALDLATGESRSLLRGSRQAHVCHHHAFAQQGELLAIDWIDSVLILDTVSWNTRHSLTLPQKMEVVVLWLTPDGAEAIAVLKAPNPNHADRYLCRWDVRTSERIDFSKVDIAVDYYNSPIHGLSLEKGTERWSLLRPDATLVPLDVPMATRHVALSTDARLMALCDYDATVRVYDVAERLAPLRPWKPDERPKMAPTPWLDEQLRQAREDPVDASPAQAASDMHEPHATSSETSAKVETFLRQLDEVGWFTDLPAAAREVVSDNCIRRASSGLIWASVMVAGFDAEQIEGEGSYENLLAMFVAASHGLFQPTAVHETWDNGHDLSVTFEFAVGHKRFKATWDQPDEWVSETFLELLETAWETIPRGVRFIRLHGGGQDIHYVLTTPEALARATKAGLIPREVLTDEDDDE